MTLQNLSKAPFPWFGGKRKAASAVWDALGDVDHYVEPFAGTTMNRGVESFGRP